jgi:hypothetical protein
MNRTLIIDVLGYLESYHSTLKPLNPVPLNPKTVNGKTQADVLVCLLRLPKSPTPKTLSGKLKLGSAS